VRDLYISRIGLSSAAGKYVDRSWEYKNRSQTHECGGTEAAQFPEKEYINGIFLQCMMHFEEVHPSEGHIEGG
jgi:hypothetical protein